MVATMLCAFAGQTVFAQRDAPDSLAYSLVRLDSSQIGALPIVRSAEIPSFLPGAVIGLSYATAFRGIISTPTFRVDGVPAVNFTFDNAGIHLPTSALRSVTATLAGTSVAYAKEAALDFETVQGGASWQGFARGSTDAGMPGSIGNVRAEAGAAGPLAPSLRAVVHLSTQSAVQSEFNLYDGPNLYRVAGLDTTISYQPAPGTIRDVVVPGFGELDDHEIPASNWNQLLGSTRVDFISGGSTELFAAGHYSRLQEREPFGGVCGACSMFNLASQRAARATSTLLTVGLNQKLGAASTLKIRFARGADELLSGVLASGWQDRSAGLDLSAWDFLVDDDGFPIDDALIQRMITNAPEGRTPFPPFRTDLLITTEFRASPYATSTGFATGGVVNGDYTYTNENRLFGSATLEGVRGRHRFLAGTEASAIDARFGTVGYISSLDMYVWKESPSILSAFVEDAFDFGDGILQVGMRTDSFDPNTQYARTPGYIVPDNMVDAKRETVFSPRVAFAVPVRRLTFRGSYGNYAHVPSLNDQFAGKNVDFFRFRNTNVNHVFSRPLDLIKVTSINLGGEFRPKRGVTISVTGFQNETNNAVNERRLAFEDPTNPGSTTFLNVTLNQGRIKTSGVDALASYETGPLAARLGITHEEQKFGTSGSDVLVLGGSPDVTTVVALLQAQTPARLGALETTFALRARSPAEFLSGDLDGFAIEESAWVTRFDARVAKQIQVAGLNALVWVDGLRLLGSSIFWDRANDLSTSIQVDAHRQTLGGGNISDNVDLTSIATAGFGVRNEVDLYLLQKAEARFGNGDGMFSAAEQIAAFGAAVRAQALATTPLSQSRRIQVGLQIDF
jgi:hypothetical protein